MRFSNNWLLLQANCTLPYFVYLQTNRESKGDKKKRIFTILFQMKALVFNGNRVF